MALRGRLLRRSCALAGQKPLNRSTLHAVQRGSSLFSDEPSDYRRFGSKADAFQHLGLHEELCQALREMQIATPTAIQSRSIQAILSKNDVLCAAQTGTGKTLAYLLPLIELIKREERSLSEEQRRKILPSRPRAVVLVPSRELAFQVAATAKRLSHHAKISSCVITSGEPKNVQVKKLARRLDLVIGTPGRIAKCIHEQDFLLSRVNVFVSDEVDVLFDAKMGFRKEIDEILSPIRSSVTTRNGKLQVILAAATVKPPLDTVLAKVFGASLRLVSTENLHRIPSKIIERFVRVNSVDGKHLALRQALEVENLHGKAMVFCMNAASCRSTDHMLRENGFKTCCLHGEMPLPLRKQSIESFRSEQTDVLVCTDLAARGLDFPSVRHVVMFDFPRDTVDYLHRAGRTGRAGDIGTVTSLVTKHDAALAKRMEMSTHNKKAASDMRADKAKSSCAASPSRHLIAKWREGNGKSGAKAHQNRDNKSKSRRRTVGYGTKKLPQSKIRNGRH